MQTTQYPRMHVICKFKCSSAQQNRNLKIYGKEKERAREREETITKLATNSFIFNKHKNMHTHRIINLLSKVKKKESVK